MSSSFPDDSAFEEEEELRTDVRIAIELALSDTLEQGDQREITNTEEEKLTHFAIRDLDLPLTYSWYLAGGHTVAEATPDQRSPWKPGQAFGDLQAQESQYDERIQELREYFRSTEFLPGYTLHQIWFSNKFEFLRDYYREMAPDKYRDLYIHSLDLREQLWNLNDALRKESQNKPLSEFGVTEPEPLLAPSTEEEIRYLISDFHMDLASTDELSPFKQDVVRGTDLIEQVISKLTHLETISVEQRMLIKKDLHDFYYHKIWKYPALAISASTAAGPNADALKQKRLLEFDGFEDKLRAEIDDITQQARRIGLLPDIDESVSDDSEKSAYLHSLIKESVDAQ